MLGVLFILLFAVTKYLTKTNYKQRNEFGLKSKGIVHCRESIMATGAFRLWLYCSSSKEVGHGHWGSTPLTFSCYIWSRTLARETMLLTFRVGHPSSGHHLKRHFHDNPQRCVLIAILKLVQLPKIHHHTLIGLHNCVTDGHSICMDCCWY